MNGTVVFDPEGVSPWQNQKNTVNMSEDKVRSEDMSEHLETWEIPQ